MSESTEGKLSTADVAYGQKQGESSEGQDGEMVNRQNLDGQSDMRQAETGQRMDGHTDARQQMDGQSQSTPSLLGNDNSTRYGDQWQAIQAKFVDEPQNAVKEADSLVAEVIQELARKFAEQREQLEGRWRSGSEVSTEDLRQALQQYRAFFQRLLAA